MIDIRFSSDKLPIVPLILEEVKNCPPNLAKILMLLQLETIDVKTSKNDLETLKT